MFSRQHDHEEKDRGGKQFLFHRAELTAEIRAVEFRRGVAGDSNRAREQGQEEPRVGKTPKSVNADPEVTSLPAVKSSAFFKGSESNKGNPTPSLIHC